MMSWSWMCWFWSLVGAGLLGWGLKGVVLRPWLERKNREIDQLISKVDILKNQSPKIQTVERLVEVPVEKLVEKVVDRLVDNPAHLVRIAELEGEVTVIAALQQQIAKLQAEPPQIIERIVEVPVEKVVEKLVEKQVEVPVEVVVEKVVDRLVDNPAHLARVAELEREVTVIANLQQQIAELQATPPKIMEKIVENRVDVPVEIVVEKVVDRVVDNPVHVARIAELEGEMAVIADLQQQIAELQSAPPKTIEKIVEQRVEVPVERVVEKVVDRVVDNPSHLARIAELEGEVAVMADLQLQIVKLQTAPPKKVEKVVEKHANVPEQKLVERTVYWDRTKGTPRPLKKSTAKGRTSEQADDLKKIYGVGPVLERFLHKHGIFTFRQVAQWGKNDIAKLEQQLPSFAGRIEREQWVRSATEEHYKKYKKWLGTGTPSITMPETH